MFMVKSGPKKSRSRTGNQVGKLEGFVLIDEVGRCLVLDIPSSFLLADIGVYKGKYRFSP